MSISVNRFHFGKQTVIGAAWAILQPFCFMVVFSVFFGSFAFHTKRWTQRG